MTTRVRVHRKDEHESKNIREEVTALCAVLGFEDMTRIRRLVLTPDEAHIEIFPAGTKFMDIDGEVITEVLTLVVSME